MNWTSTYRYGVLQGQGAYHSSIRDMSKLLTAYLQLQRGRAFRAHAESNIKLGPVADWVGPRLSTSDGGLPSTLAAAMHAAAIPLGSDEFVAQHGQVASAWQIYRASGSEVIWKSGATPRMDNLH